MAITVGTVTNGARAFDAGRIQAHTVDAGTHRLLLVWFFCRGPGQNITACTWGGVAMTELIDVINVAGNDARVQMYYMVRPVEGVANVVFTYAGNCTNFVSCQSWVGVDTDDPFGVVVTATGNTALITVTAASEAGQVVVDGGAYSDNNVGIALGADQTSMLTQISNGTIGGGSSYEPGVAATAMTWTLGGVSNWATGAVPLKAFSPSRGRATKYFFPFWDASPKLFDANGKVVDPSDILVDEWVEAEGLALPSAENPDSFIEDPSRSKIIEVNATQKSARIKTNKNQFAEVLVSRVAAGS